MTGDDMIRKAINEVDVHRLPEAVQRAANVLLNSFQEDYGGERPTKLKVCSECQTVCGSDCLCWCHGSIQIPAKGK